MAPPAPVRLDGSEVSGNTSAYFFDPTMRCVSRDILFARSDEYEQAITFQSGCLPRTYAGNRREAFSLLPERGGANIIKRGIFPASTSARKWSSSAERSSLNQPVSYSGFVYIGRYLYNLEEGFAIVSAQRAQGFHYAKSKEAGVFYWKPPALPAWALPDGSAVHQPEPQSPESINESEPPQYVDADKVLADFSQYASKENDGVKLKARYEETWKLLNGFAEHQAKCKDVTGIRIRELKQAA